MSTLIAHYTKLETAAYYILPGEALRISMGAFLNFNDPKETKAWHFRTSKRMTNQYQLFHERRIADEIKKHFGAICFSNGSETEANGFNFNRGDYKPRMWAQYGDENKGICLIFNRERLIELAHNQFESIGEVLSDDVRYFDVEGLPDFRDDELMLSPENILDESCNDIAYMMLKPEHCVPYFFLKHSDWKDEREFRIIVYMKNCPKDLYLSFDDALVGITFGCDCSPDEFVNKFKREDDLKNKLNAYEYIFEYCRSHKIDYSRIRWTNGYPSTELIL